MIGFARRFHRAHSELSMYHARVLCSRGSLEIEIVPGGHFGLKFCMYGFRIGSCHGNELGCVGNGKRFRALRRWKHGLATRNGLVQKKRGRRAGHVLFQLDQETFPTQSVAVNVYPRHWWHRHLGLLDSGTPQGARGPPVCDLHLNKPLGRTLKGPDRVG